MKKVLIMALLALAVVFGGSGVYAGSVGDNMTVTINYTPTCNITTSNYNFGSVDSIFTADGIAPSAFTITAKCSNGLPYTASILLATDDVDMINGSDKKLRLSFHDNNGGTGGQYTVASAQIGGSRTGDGNDQTIDIYPRLRPNTTDCAQSGSRYVCDHSSGYTANVSMRLTF